MSRDSNAFSSAVVQAPSSALGQAVVGMTAGQWKNVTATVGGGLTTAVCEPLGGSADPAGGYIITFLDAIRWDSTAKRIHFVGSCHFHGTGIPRYVIYNDATNLWSRPSPQPSWFQPLTSGAMHGYHHNAINVAGRRIYHSRFRSNEVWSLDLNSGQSSNWTLLTPPNWDYVAGGHGVDFVPWVGPQGSLMVHQIDSLPSNGSIYKYDVQSGAWSKPQNNSIVGTGDPHNMLEVAPNIQYAVFGGGNGSANSVHVLRPNGTFTIGATNAPQNYGVSYAILTHCPVSGDFLFFYGATNWWKYNAITNVFTQMAGTAQGISGAQNPFADGVCACSIDTYGVILFIKMTGFTTGEIWLYKHA